MHKVAANKHLQQMDREKARATKSLLEADSWLAIVNTCFQYVLTDLRKKQRQFAIGISTIFLTVSVVTFLDALINVAPAVTLISSQATTGDFDILVAKASEKEIMLRGNNNYYRSNAHQF